jgi:hypothetical protein
MGDSVRIDVLRDDGTPLESRTFFAANREDGPLSFGLTSDEDLSSLECAPSRGLIAQRAIDRSSLRAGFRAANLHKLRARRLRAEL